MFSLIKERKMSAQIAGHEEREKNSSLPEQFRSAWKKVPAAQRGSAEGNSFY